jgi:hypothetical protein
MVVTIILMLGEKLEGKKVYLVTGETTIFIYQSISLYYNYIYI